MTSNIPSIKYVIWRDGRPRFEPSPALRAMGFKGQDFRHADGDWFTYEQTKAAMIPIWQQIERTAKGAKDKALVLEVRSTLPAHRALTVADVIKAYLIKCQENQHNTAPVILAADKALSNNTIACYQNAAKQLEKSFPDYWQCEAKAIEEKDVPMILTDFGARHRLVTTRHLRQLLANAWRMSPSLRAAGARADMWWSFELTTPDPRVRAGTFAEINHLIATADDMGRPDIGDMIMFGVTTSQRQGDRIKTEVKQRGDGFIRIKQRKTGALVSLVELPFLTVRIEAALERRRKAQIISPNLFISETTGRQWDKYNYRHTYMKVRAKAAETMPSVATLTDQDMRDTAVTWLIAAGCELPEIASATGHELATIQQVIKHYMGNHPDISLAMGRKLENWINEQMTKSKGSFGTPLRIQ